VKESPSVEDDVLRFVRLGSDASTRAPSVSLLVFYDLNINNIP